MIKKITIGFFLFISFALQAQTVDNFATAKEKAAKENKKILLFFSGSDWCAPCIKFKMNFINSTQFQTYSTGKLIVFNADFPRLRKNALSKEQTKENEALAEEYNKKGQFPLVLLLSSDGKILKQWNGYPSETIDEFIKALE